MHFERMARDYAGARPSYPARVFEVLTGLGVIGPGLRVPEVGAGSGLATRPLVESGSRVTALKPGEAMADILRRELPGVPVVVSRLEDASLPPGQFDSAVAATSLHWAT